MSCANSDRDIQGPFSESSDGVNAVGTVTLGGFDNSGEFAIGSFSCALLTVCVRTDSNFDGDYALYGADGFDCTQRQCPSQDLAIPRKRLRAVRFIIYISLY